MPIDFKQSLLRVDNEVLKINGAVNRATVLAMLDGILRLSDADRGIAVSGIAGPSGSTAEKPVGTVWIAWGSSLSRQARMFSLAGTRHYIQECSAAIALDLVRRGHQWSCHRHRLFCRKKHARIKKYIR